MGFINLASFVLILLYQINAMYVIIYVINFCCFNFTLTNKSHVSHVRHALWHVCNVGTPSFYSAPYLQLVGYCFKAM
jgi:hypothetical protein